MKRIVHDILPVLTLIMTGFLAFSPVPEAPAAENALQRLFGSRNNSSERVEESFRDEMAVARNPIAIAHSHGDIHVRGWDRDVVKIEGRKVVRARDLATATEYLHSMKVEITSNGGTTRIETVRPPQKQEWRIREQSVHYDLWIPNSVPVQVESRHGAVDIENLLGSLRVKSEHGDLNLLEIDDEVTVEHEHGNLSLTGVGGEVKIRKRHGNCAIQAVAGALQLEHEHGAVEIEGIRGDTRIRKRHGNCEIKALHGKLEMEHQHGNVTLVGVQGGLRLKKAHGRVVANNLNGPVTIVSEHSNIDVTADDPISMPYHLETRHGNVDLSFPNADAVGYQLRTAHGHINAPDSVPITRKNHRESGVRESDNVTVEVAAEHGNITIKN